MKRSLSSLLATTTLIFSCVAFASQTFEQGYEYAQKQDYGNAIKIWLPLAEQGNPLAQSNLGVLYENGWGVKVDLDKARYWYELAVENKQTDAMFNLANMYHHGFGVEQDLNIAGELYLQAAEQNHGQAQLMLGVMFQQIEDFQQAIHWFQLAVENQVEGAQKNLDFICQMEAINC
ncbi:tetratricopeptide repeat protein [Thalassotalea aquiviva]|uniref:tetratricopeptide repeat protein n=1 Tax=Thalassotalea aquiviva TaxID=3242415 RepID=UPI00352AD97C